MTKEENKIEPHMHCSKCLGGILEEVARKDVVNKGGTTAQRKWLYICPNCDVWFVERKSGKLDEIKTLFEDINN